METNGIKPSRQGVLHQGVGLHEAPDHILRREVSVSRRQALYTMSKYDPHKNRRDYPVSRSIAGPSEGIIEIARLFDLQSPTKRRLKTDERIRRKWGTTL